MADDHLMAVLDELEREGPEILMLEGENNEKIACQYVGMVTVDQVDYVLVAPVQPDGSGTTEVYAYRYVENPDSPDGADYFDIEDDVIEAKVQAEAEKLLGYTIAVRE